MEQDLASRLKSKVEELISRYETLDRENSDLKARLARCEQSLNRKENKIQELEKQIGTLRLKDAFLGTSADKTQAKRKIARLIKEIDECVGLLGEE